MQTVLLSQHDKRKTEIIDCAAALFLNEGYEKTSVQKIINTLGIAKGTFYHYFKSKLDLLNQFTERESGKILLTLNELVARKEIGIVEKFNTYFQIAMNWKIENWDLLVVYLKDSGQRENRIVFETLLESNIRAAVPSLLVMVYEGIEQGYFKTDYPEFTAEALFRFGAVVTDILRPLILESRTKKEGFERFMNIMEFYQDTIEKMLGAEKGVFKIFNRNTLNSIFENSSSQNEEK